MAAFQLRPTASCSSVLAQPAGSQPQPKRVLSLLLKIQPWGNAKSERLRALLGLSGPYAAAFAPSASADQAAIETTLNSYVLAQPGCITKGAWLTGDDSNIDGCVVLQVTGGDLVCQDTIRAAAATLLPAAAVAASSPNSRAGSPSGGSELGGAGCSEEYEGPDLADQGGSSVGLAAEPAPGELLPCGMAAVEERKVPGRRGNRPVIDGAAVESGSAPRLGAVSAPPPGAPSQCASPRFHLTRHDQAQREPLHPNWQTGPRRAAMTGNNARGWLPMHVLAPQSSQTAQPPGAASPTPQPPDADADALVEPSSGSCNGSRAYPAGPSGSGGSVLAPPQPQSQASASGGTGALNSRASSTHSDRTPRSCTGSGAAVGSPVLRADSFTSLSQAFQLQQQQQAAPTQLLAQDRVAREREDASFGAHRMAPIQGPLRGSRMQGHVTAVTNPAYLTAAAAVAATAAAAAIAAVVGSTAPPAATAAAAALAPHAMRRESSRRRRLLQAPPAVCPVDLEPAATGAQHQQPPAPPAPAAAPPAASPAAAEGLGDRVVATAPFSGAAAAASALRPSLAQQRDAMGAAPRWTSPPAPATAVVAAGLQGRAVTLRPGSPFQPQSHQSHSYHHTLANMDPHALAQQQALAQVQVQAYAVAVAAGLGPGTSPPPLPPPSPSASPSGAAAAAYPSTPPGPWVPGFSQHPANHPNAYQQQQAQQQQQQQQIKLGPNSSGQQLQQQQLSRGGGGAGPRGRQRRPSLTDFGTARALLQDRPTDGWTGPGTDSGALRARTPPSELSASAPHLAGTWVAAGGEAQGGGGGEGGGGTPLIAQQQQDPPAAAGPAARPSSAAAAAVHLRPSSSARMASMPAAGGGGGGVAGGSSGGPAALGGTAWLNGGVSVLQALASGADGPVHHHHSHRHHSHHSHRQTRGSLAAAVMSSGAGGGAAGGGPAFLTGRLANVQRSLGRGGGRAY